jgi:hypothetical protein
MSEGEDMVFPSVEELRGGLEQNSRTIWLGGLDSNQDSQIQSLESYQLDDLPAEGSATGSNSSEEWIPNRTSTFLE